MKRIIWIAFLVAACSSEVTESAEKAARKQECREVIAHLFEISPETAGQNGAELVKEKIPIEDIEQCAVAHPAVLACLKAAGAVAAVKACIPPPGCVVGPAEATNTPPFVRWTCPKKG